VKKSAAIFLIALILLPLAPRAVTWQMDSNPFSFSTPITYNRKPTASSQLNLWCIPDVHRGIVTIMYNLPAAGKSAKLTIYNFLGVVIESFNVQPGNASVQWNFAKKQVVGGIYLASIRCGNIEKKTQLSIVK